MTYGRVESVTPSKDVTFRGKFDLCDISEEKIEDFEKIAEGTELPSSPLKVPKGFVRRDCQSWVEDVVNELVAKGVVPANTAKKLDEIPRRIMLDEASG